MCTSTLPPTERLVYFHLTRVKESTGKADGRIDEDVRLSTCEWNVNEDMTSQFQNSIVENRYYRM